MPVMMDMKEMVMRCDECGNKATLPNANCSVAVGDYVAISDAFCKRHKKCKKVDPT